MTLLSHIPLLHRKKSHSSKKTKSHSHSSTSTSTSTKSKPKSKSSSPSTKSSKSSLRPNSVLSTTSSFNSDPHSSSSVTSEYSNSNSNSNSKSNSSKESVPRSNVIESTPLKSDPTNATATTNLTLTNSLPEIKITPPSSPQILPTEVIENNSKKFINKITTVSPPLSKTPTMVTDLKLEESNSTPDSKLESIKDEAKKYLDTSTSYISGLYSKIKDTTIYYYDLTASKAKDQPLYFYDATYLTVSALIGAGAFFYHKNYLASNHCTRCLDNNNALNILAGLGITFGIMGVGNFLYLKQQKK